MDHLWRRADRGPVSPLLQHPDMIANPLYQEMSRAGYRSIGIWHELDPAPIARELRLHDPIYVIPLRITQHSHGRVGSHSHLDGAHLVYISTYLAPDCALEILRHELKHAHQSERCPNFDTLYRLEEDARGYDRNRYELEAKAYATL